MKNFLLLPLLLLLLSCRGHEIKSSTKKIVDKIEKYNVLDYKHVYEDGRTTEQYKNFIKLREKASIEELLILINYNNTVVKGYASWALADKKYLKLFEILATFLNSNETVPTQKGCIGSQDELANEFYYRVYYQRYYSKLSISDSIFFLNQIQKMDSVILYSDKETDLLDIALKNNNGKEKTYNRIKQLAEKENIMALVALAEYKKQVDIPFLAHLGEKSFLAISHFPNNAFWDELLQYKNTNKSLEYFLAISSYKNKPALSLLKEISQNCNSVQINLLDEALVKNYCPQYQDLILEIWEKHKTIDYTITQKLVTDCPTKASVSFAKGLMLSKPFNLLEFDYNYGTKDSIIPLMLKSVCLYDKKLITDICKKNILTSDFDNLSGFLSLIEDDKIIETTDVLVDRLIKEKYPFEIFYTTKTLLSFKNLKTNEKVKNILITKQDKWNRDNWAESFREMFMKNNIRIE